MSQKEKETRKHEESEETAPNPEVSADTQERAKKVQEEADDILDKIDEVLEKNAASFVKSFIQKGGQ